MLRPDARRNKLSNANTWRVLREEFKALSEEELRLAPNNAGDGWLRAYAPCIEGTPRDAVAHGEATSGSGDEGFRPDAVRYDPSASSGVWILSTGINEDFRARFTLEATRAGIALGISSDTQPLDFWLHYVFQNLKERRSKLLAGEGIIVQVCKASATYCAGLEQKALESSSANPRHKKGIRPEAVSANERIADSAKYPTMTVEEVALHIRMAKSSVYRLLNEGQLKGPRMNTKPGKRSKRLVFTASVKQMLEEAED